MNARKRVKDYERALKAEPGSLVLRLKLAAALRDADRHADAIAMYRSVAEAYHAEGRTAQAIAVLKSVLEIDPHNHEVNQLLDELDAARTGGATEDPTRLNTPHRSAAPGDRTPPRVRTGAREHSQPRFPAPGRGAAPVEDPWGARSLPPTPIQAIEPLPLPPMEPELGISGGQTAVSYDTGHSFDALDSALHDSAAIDDPPTLTHTPTPAEGGLPRAFERHFRAALDNLAPDGSTIEQPLSIFSELPAEALSELAARMTLKRVPAGSVIVREGDPGDGCYIVQAGTVRVLKRDPDPTHHGYVEVVRLGPGALFGEFALLADRRRHATVQALESVELFEIPRRLLRELAATYPGVNPALERLYRERLMSTLLTSAPFFAPLPQEDRTALMARFIPCRVEGGEMIVKEGEQGGGLYLIVLGSVEITKKRDGKRAVLLGTLGEGTYFGEMSLLKGTTASATVTAAGPVELAQLPPKDFYNVMSAYPVLWDELRKEARRRELMTQNLLAGDTNLV